MSADRELALIGHYDDALRRVLSNGGVSEVRLAAIRRSIQRFVEEAEQEQRWNRQRQADRNHRDHEVEDLRRHLRDRDAHIRNLEAQLRPYLVDQEPQTEAML